MTAALRGRDGKAHPKLDVSSRAGLAALIAGQAPREPR
jgi:hypothetical protein